MTGDWGPSWAAGRRARLGADLTRAGWGCAPAVAPLPHKREGGASSSFPARWGISSPLPALGEGLGVGACSREGV